MAKFETILGITDIIEHCGECFYCQVPLGSHSPLCSRRVFLPVQAHLPPPKRCPLRDLEHTNLDFHKVSV